VVGLLELASAVPYPQAICSARPRPGSPGLLLLSCPAERWLGTTSRWPITRSITGRHRQHRAAPGADLPNSRYLPGAGSPLTPWELTWDCPLVRL